jgi:trimeric autotransporter adhesin
VTDPNPILIGYLAQMIKGIYLWSLALAMAFFLSSCGDNDSTDTVVSLRIDPPTSTIAVGATTSLTVNAVLADGQTLDITPRINWSSDKPLVATVAGGIVTGVGQGTATVTAGFGALTATSQVTVTSSTVTLTGIAITPAMLILPRGISQALVATGTYSDLTTKDVTPLVTWTSADAAIVTVLSSGPEVGKVSAVEVGSTDVTATLEGISATSRIEVTSATVTAIAVTPPSESIARGVSLALNATATFSDNTTQDVTTQATWTSSDATVVSVGAPGNVRGEKEGTATITASLSGQSGTSVITVTAATLSNLQITPDAPTVAKGRTLAFTATGVFSDGSNQDLTPQVTWASATASIAGIDVTGLATATAPGTSVISATFGAISASTIMTVTNAELVSIVIEPNNPSVARGSQQSFTARGTFSDAGNQDITDQVLWTSSDPNIATISNADGSHGLASSSNVGTSTIAAALGNVSANTTLTVTAATLVSISVTPSNSSVALGQSQQFVAIGTFTDGTTQDISATATWGSSALTVATVSNAAGSQGLVNTASVGTSIISASDGAITGNTLLTVTAANLVRIDVEPSNATIAKGLSQQYTATGVFTDGTSQDLTTQVTWTSSVASVASISNAAGQIGRASTTAVGTTVVKATKDAISGTTNLTVTAATLVSIEVSPASAAVAVGLRAQYAATGTFTDGTTSDITSQVTWASASISVANVSNTAGTKGLATGIAVGTSNISATFGTVTGTALLNVTQATLQSIAVTPAPLPLLPAGLTLQYTAIGTFSDGTNQDLTTQVAWSTSVPARLSISNVAGTQGLAKALSNTGFIDVKAQLGAIVGTSQVRLTSAAVVSIAVTPSNTIAAKGTVRPFIAVATFTDASTREVTGQATWSTTSTAIAVVSNVVGTKGVATAAGVGTTAVRAQFGAVIGTTNFTVTAATLVSIQVTPTTPSIANGVNLQFTATGTYTDGSTQDITTQVTWTTSNAQVAGVSNAAGAEGLANTLSAGTTTIVATVSTLSGSTTLTVTAATITAIQVTPATPAVAVGLKQQFVATAVYSDSSTADVSSQVTWNSATLATATISNAAGSNGLASTVAVGTATISAQLGALTGSTTLTVTAATLTSIDVNPVEQTIAAGVSEQYLAVGTFSDGSTQDITTQATWLSTLPNVASASNATGEQGLVRALTPGSTQIRATIGAISGSAALTVGNATLLSIGVTPANSTIAAGSLLQYAATGTFSDGSTQDITEQVGWASSTPTNATVSSAVGSKGLAKALAIGSTNISATLGLVVGSTSLTVTSATLTSIQVTPANTVVGRGLTRRMVATGTFSDGSTQLLTSQVAWSSSNLAFVTVSNAAGTEGLASAVGFGTATITATFGALQGSTTLRVTAASLVSIAIAPLTPSLAKGTTRQFSATGTYSDGNVIDITSNVTWGSTRAAVASISNGSPGRGVATGLTIGTTTIRAGLSPAIATTVLTVTAATVTSIAIAPANQTIDAGNSSQYTAVATFSDSSVQDVTGQVTWATSNASVATVSNATGSAGLATANQPGTCTIIAAIGAVNGSTLLTVQPGQFLRIRSEAPRSLLLR